MNLRDLATAVMDGRNVTIGMDVVNGVREVLADGKITPREIVDAAHEAVDTALTEYGVDDDIVYREDVGAAALRGRIEAFTEKVADDLKAYLDDRQLTAGELNALMHAVLIGVLDVVAPTPEKQE